MQLLPRNIYRRNTFQISRNTDNIPSSKLDQGLFAAKNIHQSNTGIDRYSLGHDSQSTARDYGRGNLGKGKMLREEGYKPRILAVDEFAIHKGHSYATCVMDLEQGDILWVGKGRAMKDFEKFFEDVPSDSLSAVIAVAMDMNASYNKLVTKHLPKAQIVYDRFHMQSQFGRDVLGAVRLDEARGNKAKEKEILADISDDTDKETMKSLKQEAKTEKQEYSQLKKLRWSLLTNSYKLSDSKTEQLQSILQDHHDLAVCYAMKEEMCRLYELTDYQQAVIGWTKWFQAAKESEIPALVRFAVQKEKRLPGLAAHAIYSISTGKLEGFNNKIKVAKRIGYGYRDDDFFFTLIRYLSIPSVRSPSHKKIVMNQNLEVIQLTLLNIMNAH